MALILCSECKKEVSDKAFSCPHCGAPISPGTLTSDENVTTIQLTKKKWKKHKLIAFIILIVGFIMVMKALEGDGAGYGSLGGVLIFIAFIWAIVAKLGAWWSTG